jgi:hypothetical protein
MRHPRIDDKFRHLIVGEATEQGAGQENLSPGRGFCLLSHRHILA